MNQIQIYTDGACSGNPGPGGLGVVLMAGPHRKEIACGFRKTTNNRMELLAAIMGLSSLKRPSQVELFSDSKYLVDSINKGWVKNWKAKGWKDKKNVDLWQQILPLLAEHKVTFTWVKGHADNAFNNRCDELAVQAAAGKDLPSDEGFETGRLPQQGTLC